MAADNNRSADNNSSSVPSQKVAQHLIARTYFKVVFLQALLTICLVIPLLIISGGQAALSALIGGGIAVVGSLIYARLALVTTDSAGAILRAHYRAEVSKVLATVAMFSVVLVFMQGVPALWLFIAFMVASAGYWVSLLVIK